MRSYELGTQKTGDRLVFQRLGLADNETSFWKVEFLESRARVWSTSLVANSPLALRIEDAKFNGNLGKRLASHTTPSGVSRNRLVFRWAASSFRFPSSGL